MLCWTMMPYLACLLLLGGWAKAQTFGITKGAVVAAAERALAWQLGTLDDISVFLTEEELDTFIFVRTVNKVGWVHAAFYIGFKDWAAATDNSGHWDTLLELAQDVDFDLDDERPYHADDAAVAQLYIALSEKFDLPEALGSTIERFDLIVDNPSTASLNFTIRDEETNARLCLTRWCWCDALFMAPPGYVALSAATGDPKYLEFADAEYWVTTDYLFRELPELAPDAGLYLRDSTFFTEKLDENGNQIYWSRGNGWVFAGLPAIIDKLPAGFEGADRYIDLYKSMAAALKAVQVTEGEFAGFWGPSLLAFDLFPQPEASGSAFYVGAFAWGILEGHLDPAEYLPVVESGWKAVASAQLEDGRIGWVQQIGSEPQETMANGTQMYGTGAFLQAAAGVYKLLEAGVLEGTMKPEVVAEAEAAAAA